jgi:hypothetical protein
MSNPVHIQSFLDSLTPTLVVVDEVLNEWNGEGCLQFPILMGKVSAKLNWDDKQVRAKEPIIRDYVRNHPDWYVTRGAHGGIMKASEKQKKEAAKAAKEKAKAELEIEIAKRAAAAQTAPAAADNTVSE